MSQNDDPRQKVHEAEIVGNSENGNGGWQRSGFQGAYGARYGWTSYPVDSSGCMPFCISLALFLICLGQYGLLAAIGFFVFHVIGSIIGTVRATRLLMAGVPWNPWSWRIGNWIISFFLTVWLAGGFDR